MSFSRESLISRSNVHPEWKPILIDALQSVDTSYLEELNHSEQWLPGLDKLFGAFQRDRSSLGYILVGESPYPRRGSANGVAFYDAAVDSLWSDSGLSKAINRATSMRNIIKTALLAEGLVEPDPAGKISQSSIAGIDKSELIQTMGQLFTTLQSRGFLMLNATPVLHPDRKPVLEAKYWQGFLKRLLELVAESMAHPVTLILWGKIAETIEAFDLSPEYRKLKCEHPYNISFIHNPEMQTLFRQIAVMQNSPSKEAAP
jgi:uracil-DNA glycosylase